MPSSRHQKIAEEIVRKNPEMFNTLLEFEQTKKVRTKVRMNFTIDRKIASDFKKLCREKRYNMSAKIEEAMEGMAAHGQL